MSSSRVVPDDAKVEFWAVVADCLRAFHQLKAEAARRKAGILRDTIERVTTTEQESFYHSEPFDVACEIAGHLLNVEEHLDRYLRIRDEDHGTGISSQRAQDRRKASARE
jgi:hypothetical protein